MEVVNNRAGGIEPKGPEKSKKLKEKAKDE